LSSNGDGSYTYRPAIDYHGEDELAFTISDGQVATEGTLRLTISAQADAPMLTLTDSAGTTREIFRSGWESVANASATPTPVKGDVLEGWQRLSGGPGMPGGSFQIWSGGDRMRNALGGSLSAYPAAGSGQNWLELNIVGSTPIPTRAIERGIDTIAGATYTLSLTLAGAPGYAAEYTASASPSMAGTSVARRAPARSTRSPGKREPSSSWARAAGRPCALPRKPHASTPGAAAR
jgi:hypothetical protein